MATVGPDASVALALAFSIGQLDFPAIATWVTVEARSREARVELWTILGVAVALYAALRGS